MASIPQILSLRPDVFWGPSKGDILRDNLRVIPGSQEFGELENCIRCDWKRICSGGCPGGRIINKKAQYCKSTKQMLTYFVKRIPVLKENELLGKVLNKQIFG